MQSFKNLYQETPKKLARTNKLILEFKQNEILQHNQNLRMISLGFCTLAFSICSRKVLPSSRHIRNSLIVYFGLGSLIVPEIFNPYHYF
jgi:hypothetical protein